MKMKRWLAGSAIALASAGLVSLAAMQQSGSAAGAEAVPKHMITYMDWGRSDRDWGLPGVDPHQVAPWATWVMAKPRDASAVASAGMKTMFYSNPNRVAPKDAMYKDDDSMFAHDCSNQRIRILKQGSQKALTDPASPTLLAQWKAFNQQNMSAGHFDAVYDDTASSTNSLSAMPCHFDSAGWEQSHARLLSQLGIPVIFNGLGDGDLVRNGRGREATYGLSPAIALSAPSNVLGGSFEDCYVTGSPTKSQDEKTFGSYWQQTENTQLEMARRGKLFMCEEMPGNGDMGSLIDQRTYAEASLLLTFDPRTTMVHQAMQTASGVKLGPEVGLVAMDAASAAPSSIDALRTPGGAYAREYRACYVNGASVGPCAAVVNSNESGSVPFPLSGYSHTLVIKGSGVMDGGTISVSGPPPPSTLPAVTGVVAFK